MTSKEFHIRKALGEFRDFHHKCTHYKVLWEGRMLKLPFLLTRELDRHYEDTVKILTPGNGLSYRRWVVQHEKAMIAHRCYKAQLVLAWIEKYKLDD